MNVDDAVAVSGTRRAIKELVDGTVRVQIDIDPAFRKRFFELFSEIDMPVALAPLQTGAQRRGEEDCPSCGHRLDEHDGWPPTESGQVLKCPAAKKRAPNELARRLHVDGYFRNPKLWAAVEAAGIYSQKEHKEWIESLPCCWYKVINNTKHLSPCQGEICAHHTPSAALPAAGRGPTPRKVPDWYTAPLCHHHHTNGAHGSANRDEKEALLYLARELVAERVKGAMKAFLGLDSLADLTEEQWALWTKTIGLEWKVSGHA